MRFDMNWLHDNDLCKLIKMKFIIDKIAIAQMAAENHKLSSDGKTFCSNSFRKLMESEPEIVIHYFRLRHRPNNNQPASIVNSS